MILKPSVVLMCVMALGCANIQQMESGRAIKTAPTTSAVTYHHLKWITNQTKFPIEMSVPIPVEQEQQQTAAPTAISTTSFWNWLRLNDYQWVSKMKELLKSFLVTETRDRATLMVLNYDNRTHEQLGSYEPKMMRASENSPRERVIELASGIMSNKRDIFTLAYLKDHYIKTEKFPDRIKVTCYADFLIANTTMVDTIMSLMERYASFKMAVKSTQTNWAGPAPGPRFSSHNRNHVRPFEVRRPSTQEQEQEQEQQQQQQQQQYEELQRQQIRQQQIQEIQRLQQQQQLSQQLQQIQRQWQQHQLKQMQQQQQQQQQEQLPITLQSFLEKMISYQSPPPELLEHDRLVQQQSQQQFMQPIQLVQVTQKQTSQPPVFKPAEKILVDAQQKQKAEKEQEVGSQKDQPSPQQPTGSAQQASQQSQQQQQQQQQQKQQQDKQLQAQGTTQYQQLYHPVHQPTMMLPMSNYPVVSNFHPAVYQNDLVNFYSSLFNPSPVSFSHPRILIQQQQQQLQPLQQTEQQQPELQQPKQQQQQQQPTMQPPSSQIVTMSLPLQPSQPNQLYPNMAFVLPQTPYEYLFNPRLGKREVRSSMVSSDDENDGKYDYEQDYDESRFLKIRLSLGPISIYRPFENEEAVSCSLNLVNIDTLLSDYQNKIIETIDTSEYNPNQEDEEFDEKQEQKPEHNDLMFMIDGKNADPTAEIKKIKTPKQQEETMNKVSDKSVAELIEMERQMNKVTSASTPRVAFSSLTAIICVFITFFF